MTPPALSGAYASAGHSHPTHSALIFLLVMHAVGVDCTGQEGRQNSEIHRLEQRVDQLEARRLR